MGYIIASNDWRENVNVLISIALEFESNKYEMEMVKIGDDTPVINVYGYPSTLQMKED